MLWPIYQEYSFTKWLAHFANGLAYLQIEQLYLGLAYLQSDTTNGPYSKKLL